MESEKLGKNKGYSQFTAIPHAKWIEIKQYAISPNDLSVGTEYQIVSGSCSANRKVKVRRLESLILVENSSQKLVFESGQSGKLTYFPGMFDKIAIFNSDSDIRQTVLGWAE